MALGWITLKSGDRISVFRSSPFVAVHFACIAAFFLKFHWSYLIVCLALYYGRMFFVTAGYHRYFSHRSFKTSRLFQFVMALMATTSTQKGVLWWAANHRHHHRYSDTEDDLHSPSLRGFLWSHIGWILSDRYTTTRVDLIHDFQRYPELRWLNKYHMIPPVALGLVMFVIGGWGLLVWGYCISTVILWHSSFTINSLSHIFGRRRYPTADSSKNNALLALLTMVYVEGGKAAVVVPVAIDLARDRLLKGREIKLPSNNDLYDILRNARLVDANETGRSVRKIKVPGRQANMIPLSALIFSSADTVVPKLLQADLERTHFEIDTEPAPQATPVVEG